MRVVTMKGDETRLEYLLRVAIEYIDDDPYRFIFYDDASCDGICLAEELRMELDELRKSYA